MQYLVIWMRNGRSNHFSLCSPPTPGRSCVCPVCITSQDSAGPVVFPGACRGCGIHVALVHGQLAVRWGQAWLVIHLSGSGLLSAEGPPHPARGGHSEKVAVPGATVSLAPRAPSRPRGSLWAMGVRGLLWGLPGLRALVKDHDQEEEQGQG